MSNQFGPWATAIAVGANPQLSSFWKRRLTMLVPASQTSPVLSRRNLLWLGVAGVLTSVLPTLRPAPATADEEKPSVLIYEIDPDFKAADSAGVDMDKLLKVLDRRLNAGSERVARVRKLDATRIEVALIRTNDVDRQRVERLIARPGTLEFRILANNRNDKAIIERAEKEATKSEVLDASGKRLAWWVPVKSGSNRNFEGYPDIIRRTQKLDDREITEILVVPDSHNVTGSYLTQAKSGPDQKGQPCLEFTFNKEGGELFGKLTSEHLPDNPAGFTCKLGIILDGELYSAPVIVTRISDRGQITGSFTREEVSDLADTLNAGRLPAPLRLVK